MAVYKIFPKRDSSIYSEYPDMNTGLDEILEIHNKTSLIHPTPQVARSIMEFDTQEISEFLNGKSGYTINLKMYVAQAKNTTNSFTLDFHPLTQEWQNGTGKYLDIPQVTNGVSWNSYDSTNSWVTAGGDFDSGIKSSIEFNYSTHKDIEVNVTDIVNLWSSNIMDNHGFLIKLDDNTEFNVSSHYQPELHYFGINTHTIYPPHLEIKYDDSVYTPGTLPAITTSSLFISLSNNSGEFFEHSINRFRLNVRPQFPERTFKTTSLYTVNHALPEGTLYAIKDLDTDEFVVDFDENYTKVSCDETSNYFDINMFGLQPERYYKILIKTVVDGSTIIKDDKFYFKIIKG